MRSPSALDADELYRYCDPRALPFRTTAELDPMERIFGQDRATEALRFGIRMAGDGYNIYALGPSATDKEAVVRRLLSRESAERGPPGDLAYVNNFQDAQKPRMLHLPAGRGSQLRDDMRALIDDLRSSIPAAFESEDYRNRRAEIEQELNERQQKALQEIEDEAQQHGMTVVQTPQGFAIAPVKDGRVVPQEQFHQLGEDEQKRIQDKISELSDKLRRTIQQFPSWHKERREKERELDREVTMSVVGMTIQNLRERYEDLPAVVGYLDEVRRDVIDNAQDFRQGEEQQNPLMEMMGAGERRLKRYEVNLLVDNSETGGEPVVYEPNPSYQNLVGRVEHTSQFGALTTDFSMIRPGALHRANGGYLLLNIERVLTQPYAWPGLKRALYGREIRIESLAEMLSMVTTASLEPEPMPLDVKVVLLGDRMIYYLLYAYDPDFAELFKVGADFEEDIDRSDDNVSAYARLVGTLARDHGLRAFDDTAVARVIEHSARQVSDSEKLSMHTRNIRDLLREADFQAGDDGRDTVTADDVQRAIDRQVDRLDRIRDRLHEAIERDTLLIDTDGEAVGQINALSVLQTGDFAFGQPARITATARLGKGEVVDIEREAELGGNLHSKGVLILSSFLSARYAADLPLSLSASLVFEQTYGGVDGDSASAAEACALVSALSGCPIRQSLAITGSINQHGRVQAIGGVNEKIEGFFHVCRTRGLTGEQGVIIPADNVKHLMPEPEVVTAARQGRFHVYPVTTVDQAVAVLTGVEPGEADASGVFPEGSVNRRVRDRLAELSRRRAELGRENSGDDRA